MRANGPRPFSMFSGRGWLLSAPRLAFVLLVVLVIAGCDKPDASNVVSPSAKALLGTATGAVAFSGDPPPAATANPAGWDVRLENARFSTLENGQHSIQVVMQVQSRPGPPMEIWLTSGGTTVFHWVGGSSHTYDGVVCFQLRLEENGQAVPLGPGPHEMTVAFADPTVDQPPVVVRNQRVAGGVPTLPSVLPDAESRVGEELLGCPRQVI